MPPRKTKTHKKNIKHKMSAELFIKLIGINYYLDSTELTQLSNFYDVDQLLPYIRDDKIPVLALIVRLRLVSVFDRIVNRGLLSQFNISMADSSGNTALLYACRYGLSNVALELIKTGQSNPGQVNEGGNTALIWACRSVALSDVALSDVALSDVALELIKTGQSNPGHINNNGNTALIWACQSPSLSNVALELIKTGQSNPGQINQNGSNTALMFACCNKFTNVALELIKTGQSAPDHISDNNKNTALIYACSYSLDNVTLALIETGISKPGQINILGETALIWACINGLSHVALELIKTGQSKPGHFDDDGNTALIEACHAGLSDVAMALMDTKQANVAHKTNTGITALYFAKKNNMHSVVSRIKYLSKQPIIYKMPIIQKSLSPISMAYDVIGLEDVKIKTYLSSDFNNIAIWANNRWFLSNKTMIRQLVDTKDSIVFKCNSASGLIPKANVNVSKEYFRLKSIGIYLDYVPMSYINFVLQSWDQYYMLEPTLEILPSVVSYNIYKNGGMWTSGSHCQEGQGGKVYIMRRVTIKKSTRKSSKEMIPGQVIEQNVLSQKSQKSQKSKTHKQPIFRTL